MKIAVFGATGSTGQLFVQGALDRGHEILALVRRPEKIKARHSKLKAIKVNIFNAENLSEHLGSCDAVVSCLGCDFTVFSEVTLYSDSAKAIVGAMRRTNMKRFVFLSCWFVDDRPEHPWLAKLIIKPALLRMLADIRRMELYFMNECPDINFTAIRPPRLTSDQLSGLELLVRADVDFTPRIEYKLPRTDLARFMLNVVMEDTYYRKRVAVGLPGPLGRR